MGPVTNRAGSPADDLTALRLDVANRPLDLQATFSNLLDGVSRSLGVPIALLSRQGERWRFEAESIPPSPDATRSHSSETTSDLAMMGGLRVGAPQNWTDAGQALWTGLITAESREREWILIVPGSSNQWRVTPDLDQLIDRFGRRLEDVLQLDNDRRLAQLHRRLHAFVRRLTRLSDVELTHACILRTMVRELASGTGSIAVFSQSEQALKITATVGYPRAIVEHVRIRPGTGIIGQTYATGRAVLGRSIDQGSKRLRYRTDSYLSIPLRTSARSLAVVTLTDRADGHPFDSSDLVIARLLAAPAALALDKLEVTESLDELTRAAAVDPVTGLFNRRYFEARIEAEVQRARRQQQDLALMMVDIDDFKRINDTFGHIEGDRALRDVADLLRRGIRIFDLCARYGGEEFVIVMPGASREVAVQVAERIRQSMHDRSRVKTVPMTVSIGVGFLGPDQSTMDLIFSADKALIAAKGAGKNIVKTN